MSDLTTTHDLAIRIEALLFALGRPLSHNELAGKLDCTVDEVRAALAQMSGEARGIVLVDDGKMVELRTAAQSAPLIEKIRKDEYSREVGKAGLEALAAIMYRGPLTRAEIDFIRGVNSSQTIRTLTMRGLVRKIPNPKDERSFLYEPTTELLSQMGVTRLGDLPQFDEVRDKLTKLEEEYRSKQSEIANEEAV